MASDRTLFKFNLLPAKSTEEVAMELDRDNSLLYALVLLVFASFVYLVTIMLQGFVINPRRAEAQQELTNREVVRNSYYGIRATYGELYIKSRTLKPLLEKNIDTKEIFRVADDIQGALPNLVIESYSRERSGTFVFTVISISLDDVEGLLRKAQDISGVSNVLMRSSVMAEDKSLVRTTIALDINPVGTDTDTSVNN